MLSHIGDNKSGAHRMTRQFGSRALVVLGVMAGLVSFAQAADLPMDTPPDVPMDAPMAQPDQFSWTGVYLGGTAGYDWNRDHLYEYATATGAFTGAHYPYKQKGGTFGLIVGSDYQIGNIVMGAALNIDGAKVTGQFIDPGIGRGRDKIDFQATMRGKLGYGVDRVLVYGTAGLAAARMSNTYTYLPTDTSETFKKMRYGWTIGAGVDYAVTDNVIVGLDYTYVNYNTFSNDSVVAFPGLTGTANPSSHQLKMAVKYKF